MKVVLFWADWECAPGIFENVPKPMVPSLPPILWHLMKYYASYGTRSSSWRLATGRHIKDYFLNYDECLSKDFVLNGQASPNCSTRHRRLEDHLLDTGTHSNIGSACARCEASGREEMFLANYADGLSDLNLGALVDFARGNGKIATSYA